MAPHTPRNPRIDVLRGLSVLLVIIFHLELRFPLSRTALGDHVPLRVLHAISKHGFDAVTIFFVISGYLITKHTLRRHGELRNLDLRAFYIRRAARILPFLLLLVGVLSGLHLMSVPGFTIQGEGQSLGRSILAALFLHINLYEAWTGYLPGAWDVMWSLSIEEVFYLGFPLVCITLRHRWVLLASFLALALSLPWLRADLSGIWMSKAYLPGMASIAMGVFAASLSHQRTIGVWPGRLLRLLGCVGMASVLVFSDLLWPRLRHTTVLLLTASTGGWLLAVDRGGPLHPIPGLRWLRRVGRLSYEIYLTHMFIVLAGVHLWTAMDLDGGDAWLLYPPVVLGSVGLGLACSHLFTNPVDRRLRASLLRPG